jgi:hypothetical protein
VIQVESLAALHVPSHAAISMEASFFISLFISPPTTQYTRLHVSSRIATCPALCSTFFHTNQPGKHHKEFFSGILLVVADRRCSL